MFTRSLSGTIIKGFIPVLILMILLAGCRPDDKNTGTAGPAGIKIKSIFIDPLGRKWFATENGLSVYNDKEWKTYTTRDGLGGNTVFSFAHSGTESDLVVFTGTNNGVTPVSPGEEIALLTALHKPGAEAGKDSVLSLSYDPMGYLWMADHNTVAFYHNSSVSELPQQIKTIFAQYYIQAIGSSADGWNYFGTGSHGVARIKSTPDGISGASLYEQPWSGLPSMNVFSVLVLENGDQWYGTDAGAVLHEGTLAKQGWTEINTSHGLINDTVLCIYKDLQNRIWFGTKGGVCRLMSSAKDSFLQWESYTTADGLADNTVYSIAAESATVYWFGTGNGISRFDGISWQTFRKK